MKRNLKLYIPIAIFIICIGLPSRIIPQYFPNWYVNYCGDFLWAILVYLLISNIFQLSIKRSFIFTLLFAYSIEASQLFHPPWLDSIRSIKLFALIIGHTFLWTDILAYTLGISLIAIIDYKISMKAPVN